MRESLRERGLVALARRSSSLLERVFAGRRARQVLNRRATRAWQTNEEPLIVCYGNINRSPFAGELTRLVAGKRAHSTGLHPVAERAAAPRAIERAQSYGIDLTAHRSRSATSSDLRMAPCIFVFDLENVARIAIRSPRALLHTHLLGTLNDHGPLFLIDPHGQPDAVLVEVFEQISAAISASS